MYLYIYVFISLSTSTIAYRKSLDYILLY